MPASALDLGYRRSAVAAHQVVVGAELALAPGDPGAGAAELAEIVAWRRANQPGGPERRLGVHQPARRLAPAASSTRPAPRACGIGTAEVSTKHANFIQADEGGRADDVCALMDEVRRRVARRHRRAPRGRDPLRRLRRPDASSPT